MALREESQAPVFIDLNLRAPWWTEELVRECIDGSEWLKASAGELGELVGLPTDTRQGCETAARSILDEYDVAQILVTRGPEGSLLVRREGDTVDAPASDGLDIIDTVGAGDAFSAVFCHGVLQDWDPQTTLERANAFALDVCGFRGATSPDLALYEKHLRRWSEPAAWSAQAGGLHVLMLSVHGLVRGTDIELGRDADTGGQVSYVVDQARALVRHPEVDKVTVVTRRVEDRRIDKSYAVEHEDLGGGAVVTRLPFGPRRYLHKETLWPYLDELLDQLTRWVRTQEHAPDVIHGHYADAGYVGAQLSKLLGVPFIFTGHSLGRVKRARLLADGLSEQTLETRYRISTRIEAEEQALEAADLVIASTRQEVRAQFERYDHYAPERMRVIPPGVDLTRFSPPSPGWDDDHLSEELGRFLNDTDKPLILALARADERKNFAGLIRAYAEHDTLRETANLAVVAGNRDDIRGMDAAPRRVLTEILMLIDAFDLYGSVAFPKHHRPGDVPGFFRYAARTKGLFVNAALTEPFGLTLLEAAATGLPVVATNDGGPRDILAACQHGVLADPLDPMALGEAMARVLASDEQWGRWSKNGVSRVHRHFSWSSHAVRYVEQAKGVLSTPHPGPVVRERPRLAGIDRLVMTDVDGTLTGDEEGLAALLHDLGEAGPNVGFGIATGRSLGSVLDLLSSLGVETPDVMITSSGTEIRYGRRQTLDRSWERQIRHQWHPERIREVLESTPGVRYDPNESTTYRLRFQLDDDHVPSERRLRGLLRRAGIRATVILDHETNLDVLPMRASPGLALRFFGFKWHLAPEQILVAGDSGNDRNMLEGEALGVVVGNHTGELDALRGRPRVYFANREHAWGVRQGIEHYDFFGQTRIPSDDESANDR
jgi:sucrose-phosphate synthase